MFYPDFVLIYGSEVVKLLGWDLEMGFEVGVFSFATFCVSFGLKHRLDIISIIIIIKSMG